MDQPKFITSHKLTENIKKWGNNRPTYVVIHFTSGFYKTSDTSKSMLKIYESYLERKSNAHYLVGKDETWEMVNPKLYMCMKSCGSSVGRVSECKVDGWGPSTYKGPLSMSCARIAGHQNTINVEVCSCKSGVHSCIPMDSGWYFNPSTYMNAVRLFAWICDEWSIPVDHIIMHNQVTGKLCPAMWCNSPGAESEFYKFRRDVSNLMNDIQVDTNDLQVPPAGTILVLAGSFYYNKPDASSIVLGQALSDIEESYSIEKNGFYYTEKGWVQS